MNLYTLKVGKVRIPRMRSCFSDFTTWKNLVAKLKKREMSSEKKRFIMDIVMSDDTKCLLASL